MKNPASNNRKSARVNLLGKVVFPDWRQGHGHSSPAWVRKNLSDPWGFQKILFLGGIFLLAWSVLGSPMEIPQVLGKDHHLLDHEETVKHGSETQNHQPQGGQWEGSTEGIAYSEFNHTLAGIGVIFVGLSELRTGLGLTLLPWARFLLPLGLLASGAYLMIWSDHDAWPIGSLSFGETFFGNYSEILQHKFFAVLLLGVGLIELFIRLGRIKQRFWNLLLPGFALVAGVLLFTHMHGPHPATYKIMIHHTIMGVLAIAAGSLRCVSEFTEPQKIHVGDGKGRSPLKIAWGVLVLLIGIQLLFYSES